MRLIDADTLREDWLYNGENEPVYDTNNFLYSIDEQPTIDPESLRPHAKWLSTPEHPICSNCDKETKGYYNSPFCPNCGAKMKEEVQ